MKHKLDEKVLAHREAVRRWRLANLEKARASERASARRRYQINPEKVLEKNRRWRQANPEKARTAVRQAVQRWRQRQKGIIMEGPEELKPFAVQCSVCHFILMSGNFLRPPQPSTRWCPHCRQMVSCEVKTEGA